MSIYRMKFEEINKFSAYKLTNGNIDKREDWPEWLKMIVVKVEGRYFFYRSQSKSQMEFIDLDRYDGIYITKEYIIDDKFITCSYDADYFEKTYEIAS